MLGEAYKQVIDAMVVFFGVPVFDCKNVCKGV